MNEDIKHLSGIGRIGNGKYERLELYRDFFSLLAIEISNSVDPVHYRIREQEAQIIAEKYTAAELEAFCQFALDYAHMVEQNVRMGAMKDLLGGLYEEHGHVSQSNELSPSGIATICNLIGINNEKTLKEKGYLDFLEPTCGSGAMVLSMAEQLMHKGYNPSTQLVVLANDINPRCVEMTYIQLSMNGIPAVVTQADIFTLDEVTRWYTPMYILGKWVWRKPMSHTTGRNRDDERLKMMTDPMYAAIRQIFGWSTEA